MINKKLIVILAITLAGLLVIGVASAADSNRTDILSIDESASTVNENLALDYSPDTSGESNDTNIIENNENNLLSADNDESGNVLREGTGTFADLQTEISTALSSGNKYVKLTKDTYTYAGSGSQIEIDTHFCTIDGNGAVIDMANSDIRAFHVTAHYVTIKNLTIKNVNFNDGGGAIYFDDESIGTVTNCNFTNNKVTGSDSRGGAISINSGTVTNCNFNNNTANNDGGAIWMLAGSVENCNFTNNKVTGSDSMGGAISINSGTVTNCNFNNNTANYGGAIYFDSGTVTNCNFNNNTANYGGAIYFDSGTVINCNFTANKATGSNSWGGAIFFASTGTVTNCNFTGNNATTGSAIYFYRNSANKTVSNSRFLNNRANAETLEVTKNENNITITFTGNDNLLNAIYSTGDVTFTNVTYWSAKGINNTGNSTIKPSRSNKEAGQNITVEIYDSKENLVDNVTLVTDDNGQVTYDLSKLSNANYTYNAYHIEDCYYTYAEYKDIGDFNRLQNYINAADANSVLTLYRDYTFTIGKDENLTDGIVVDKPITINGNGHTIDALQKARIFHVTASSINITGLTFKNGKANNGGAIYFENTISNSNINASFINNTATYGGANFFDAVSGSTISGTYTSNNATISGGTNYFNKVSGSNITGTYTNNTATYGGANFFDAVSGSTISGTYTSNNATMRGGANCFDGKVSGSTISGTYTSNNATMSGGTNHFYSSVSNLNIGGTYINNSALVIIYFENKKPYKLDAQVNNAIFLNNNCIFEIAATKQGVVVKDSWFGNNASNFMNRPNNFNVKMDNWLFLNATADHNSLLILDSSNIIFKLNSTNGTDVSDFDNSKLPPVNLTLTATNGDVENTTTLDNIVKYMATEKGKGSVTAKIENAQYTIYFDNSLRNVNLSASAENITYLENEILTLTYNNTATGKVNITLKSKNHNKTIERDINQTFTITDLPAGDYDVIIEYFGDNVFSNATAYANFTVKKITTEVIPDNETIDLFVDEEYKITYTLKPENALGNISFSSDDSSIVSVNSVSGDITAKGDGLANITVSFSGSENYTASNATITVNVKKIPTQITVNSSNIDMKVNDEADILASLNPANAGNLTYKSSDENIVKVEEGKIIALREGNATITLSFKGDNKYAEAENKTISVTVNLKDASVDVNNKTLNLLVGDNFTIVATTVPEGVNVTFVQDDSGVYIVDKNGNVIALKEGKGSVLVKVGGDGIYAKNSTIVNVTVSKVPTEITVLNDTLVLEVLDEVVTGASLTPADAGNVTYSISNSSVVKVEDGKIIALAEGKATITVSFKGDTKYLEAENKTINVTVNLNDASVSVNNNTLDLFVDDTFNLIATTEPKGLTVNFTSDNSSVVTVDKGGNVVAVSEGTATITVSVGGDGIYVKNSTNVTVTVSKVPTEINVDTVSLDLFVGDETVVDANLTPGDAGNVTFTSSNSSVVIVDGEGNVIANGKGQAIITVSFAGDNKYAACENKTVTVEVSLNDASVTVDNDTLDLKVDETYQINATKHPDTILLEITYKSSNDSVVTVDENGTVTAVGVGTAIITLSVGDGEIYAENSTNITVTVKKVTPKLTAKAKTFKDTTTNKKYTVTLKDNKGKAIKGAKVYLKVNGNTYTKTTNEKGQATFTIKLNKKGTYTATITYKGNKNYNKITKKAKITVKQTWKTISKGSKNHAMVKKIQKALKKNGYYLTYKGHYLKIDGIFHDCTQRAVKEFQKAKGLKVTGKVDYKTAKKLKLVK